MFTSIIGVLVVNGIEFKDRETVNLEANGVVGEATLVYKPNYGFYPKSKSNWYLRDSWFEYVPFERFKNISKIKG